MPFLMIAVLAQDSEDGILGMILVEIWPEIEKEIQDEIGRTENLEER